MSIFRDERESFDKAFCVGRSAVLKGGDCGESTEVLDGFFKFGTDVWVGRVGFNLGGGKGTELLELNHKNKHSMFALKTTHSTLGALGVNFGGAGFEEANGGEGTFGELLEDGGVNGFGGGVALFTGGVGKTAIKFSMNKVFLQKDLTCFGLYIFCFTWLFWNSIGK